MMKTFLFPVVLAGVLLSGCSSRVDDYEALLKEVCEPQAEIERLKADFAKQAKFAASWWNANKPALSNVGGTANYQLVMKAYKGQRRLGNPFAYLRTLVSPELKVMLGDTDITGSITSGGGGSSTTTPNPGGGGNLDG